MISNGSVQSARAADILSCARRAFRDRYIGLEVEIYE